MKRAIDRLESKMSLYEHVFISRQDLSNTQAEGLVEHFGIVPLETTSHIFEKKIFSKSHFSVRKYQFQEFEISKIMVVQ